MKTRLLSSLWLCATAALLASCAQEQPPIVRVQPDSFDKEFFIGKDFKAISDDPEFWSQGTLVDVGYGAGQDGLFTSTYAQPLSRIKWTVQEDLLIARLAYERIEGSDGRGAGKATNDGIVVAAYKISKHFDVKRDYNPSTGEQLNVIEENDKDRPWYERTKMRVDWSKNLSTDNFDYDSLSQIGLYGGISYEPLAYFVNEPGHPDAPHFDPAVGYLDVTNKAFAKPLMIDLARFGGGMVPACMYDADFAGGVAPAAQCSPVELTIRQSFRKVQDNDYEAQDWDGLKFQAFGAFTSDRKGYARNYGMTDTQWHRFINRYNIWERSHVYTDPAAMTGPVSCFTPTSTPVGADPHRDLDKDGTEDECKAVGSGSRCDTFRQACTLPFKDRKVRPIAWYYASGSSPEFFDATRKAAHEWDVALRSAVQTARYSECVRTKGTACETTFPVYNGQMDDNQDAIDLAGEVDDCRDGRAYVGEDCTSLAQSIGAKRKYAPGVRALAALPEMLVLCHSPVEAHDPGPCGSPRLPDDVTALNCFNAERDNDTAVITTCRAALNARKGDLRYHQVNTITTPQTPSPWGIMVDANDPLTGEIVSASINVWSHVTDLWSQSIVDTSRYIKGELTTPEITDGDYIRDWASAAEAASSKGSLPQLTAGERDRFLAEAVGLADTAEVRTRVAGLKASPLFKDLKQIARDSANIRLDAKAPSSTKPIYEARRKHALNTATEAALTTKMMQSFAGGDGKLSSDMLSELASPLRGANPVLQREVRQAKELALSERGACVMNEAPAPLAIADVASLLEEKFGKFDRTQSKDVQAVRAAAMRKYLAQRAHYAVVTHEMGHSIGLRHNFVSSADAFNYRPQYWQLRTDNGVNTTKCTGLDGTGACVGPRYFDPINANEKKNLLTMFMQSSTMDYAGEATQDMIGLGAYDFAAARMFYGDVVSVFTDASYRAGTPRGTGAIAKLDNFGGILGIRFEVGAPTLANPKDTRTIHYSELQKEFQMIQSCEEVDPANFKPAHWDDAVSGVWHPMFDGLIVNVAGKYSRCRQQPVDYVAWADMAEPGSGRGTHAVDPNLRLRVPYGFATDRWADLGNLSVYRHDNGADPYELFDFLITQQEVNHIFDNYRRNRQSFSVRGAATRSLTRYNEKLRDSAKGIGLIANIYRDFAVEQGYDFDGLWPYLSIELFGDNMLASGLGFDHFSKQLARPQAGPHQMGTQGAAQTKILRSTLDTAGNAGPTVMTMPNGATGYYGNVAFGGRPLENALATTKGEYDSQFTVNAGSYYEKAWTAMLFTESVDNFISDSRRDFLDARYRSVSLADLFPEGYRRWLGNNLTGDDVLKGPRVAASTQGVPSVEQTTKYPSKAVGWTQWWKATPETCFQREESLQCETASSTSVAIDPQVGWEQQKFLIAWTLMYLPENQQQTWLNQMNIWEVGADTDPGFPNRIELHVPKGKTYIAKSFGKETILGKRVEKGISARMLEWGNELLARAYEVTPGPDADLDGAPDWVLPTITNGQPRVKYDPSISYVAPNGQLSNGRPGCNPTDNSSCTCASNKACLELSKYEEAPFFMRQAMRDFGLADPSMKGIY